MLLSGPAAFSAEKRKPISLEEAAKLKRENEVLRAENQRLRKLLAESIEKSVVDRRTDHGRKTPQDRCPARRQRRRRAGNGLLAFG